MAVRAFEGGTAGVRCAAGNVDGIIAGASTMVAIAKMVGSNGTWFPAAEAFGAGGNARIWYRAGDSDSLHLETSGTGTSAVSFTAADDWCLVAITKGADGSTARMHKCVLATDTWTHTDAGTVGDAAEAVAAVNLGWDDRWDEGFEGLIALVGMWKSVLSDAQIEGLRSTLDAWSALSPDGLWPLNQESTSTAVEDITGGGADQASLVGTSVVTDDDPPGFSFESGTEVALGAASTVDAAQSLTAAKNAGLGAAGESETAYPLTSEKQAAIGPATEADAARPLTATKAAHLEPAVGIDQARPVAVVRRATLGAAAEQNRAHSVAAVKRVQLGTAREVDTTQAVAAVKRATLGVGVERNAARPLSVPGAPLRLDAVRTVDAARPVTAVLIRRIGAASGADAVRPLIAREVASLGTAREQGRALVLTGPPSGATTIPPPDTGTTSRPDTGTVSRPATGVITRPTATWPP